MAEGEEKLPQVHVVIERHLDWSDKQKRILTADNRADDLYTADRGFPFLETELPHYHCMQGDTHAVFSQWKGSNHSNDCINAAGSKRPRDEEDEASPLAGAWTRLVFVGGWEHTSMQDERTFNLQTNHLFMDLRIPRTRETLLQGKSSLQDLAPQELCYYARQHVFAGYTQMAPTTTTTNNNNTNSNNNIVCTRHHCIDWNFVGVPRTRPNKWYAELKTPQSTVLSPPTTWKEWAFATDERGQSYYLEQWQRLPGGDASPMLALRKKKQDQPAERDGILLIVGDHFSYILGRDLSSISMDRQRQLGQDHSSLVGIVDAAVDRNDVATAMAYLSLQAGHGRIANGWIIDCAIEPWREGTPLWTQEDSLSVVGNADLTSGCCLQWDDQAWELFDTSLTTLAEVRDLLTSNRIESHDSAIPKKLWLPPKAKM
jgi:hypothetical protein